MSLFVLLSWHLFGESETYAPHQGVLAIVAGGNVPGNKIKRYKAKTIAEKTVNDEKQISKHFELDDSAFFHYFYSCGLRKNRTYV